MASKVKSYTRKNGTKVKAHVRKNTNTTRFANVGKRISSDLAGIIKSTKRTKPKKMNLRRDLNKLVRSTKRANAKRK